MYLFGYPSIAELESSKLQGLENGEGDKSSATNRGFDNVSLTPRKTNQLQSPIKKTTKKREEEEADTMTFPSGLANTINAVLDTKRV